MTEQSDRLLQLLDENVMDAMTLAACIGLEEKQILAAIDGKKPLKASLCRQIEQAFSKPKFWLEGESSGAPSLDLFG